MKFTEMGLSAETLKSLKVLGFEDATPIQAEAIPLLLAGDRDFVGLASTGTGKTAAFGLPLLERVDPDLAAVQGIVLCPTRELCLQIAGDLRSFAEHRPDLRVVAVYGGAAISGQIRELKRGAQVVVATPGRLLDLIGRRALPLDQVKSVVLDEADEMLNMGFKEELDQILGAMPEGRLTWLFSATMARGVERIAKSYLKDPRKVSVEGQKESGSNIEHICFMVHERDRYAALKRILDFFPEIYGLVFCRTRAETQEVAERLVADGYSAEALHGDLSQGQRDAVMRKFRQRTLSVLVATDVAARGIDVDDISHVIHYRLSDEPAAYIHRSGRTARAGRSGISIALINMRERRRIMELERRNKIRIRLEKVPDGQAVCERQLMALLKRVVESPVNEEEIRDYLPMAYEALCHLEKKEIIKRFVSVEFNHFLEYYRGSGDINVEPSRAPKRDPRQQRSANQKRNRNLQAYDSKRLCINLGRVHKVNAGAIVRLLCENCGLTSKQIGSIDVMRDHSFFDVDKEAASSIRKGMQNLRLDGRKISIRSSAPASGDSPRNRRIRKGGGSRRG
jgi:ATP-dependent RNA helicase DeaD